MAVVFISCQNEDQPTQKTSDEEWQLLSKKPKPGHNPDLEWIEFAGDLEGGQVVEGCCPNAGPSPDYTMTLSDNFPADFRGTYTGNIFLNSFRL